VDCLFLQAAFTPEELYSRKRTLDRKVADVTPIVKKLKLSSAGSSAAGAQAEGAEEEVAVLSDEDVTKLVGTADACKLEVSYTICRKKGLLLLTWCMELRLLIWTFLPLLFSISLTYGRALSSEFL